jgi:hypothetical protein
MFLNHPLVMLGGDGRQALWKEVVERVAPLHLDHVSLLAEVLDIVNEKQFDTAPRTLGEMR